jgi:RIO kinase 2
MPDQIHFLIILLFYFIQDNLLIQIRSDIYIVIDDKGEEMALKFHRLGRTSFRTVKNNRDYLKHRKSASWFYLSRLAAIKEFAYMKALYDAGFPVPRPVDFNRHCVLMSLVKATPLCNVRELQNPEKVYSTLMDLLVKLANHGLIHGDFNEFNILINDDEEITLIDFPQMVSIEHENAEMYFNRDVNCIRNFFKKKFDFDGLSFPVLGEDTFRQYSLDSEIQASGFDKGMQEMFEKVCGICLGYYGWAS